MWIHAQGFSDLPVHADGLITVYESVNTVQIASAGAAPESARAFLVGYRTPIGVVRVIAYMYFDASRHCEVYVPPDDAGGEDSKIEDGIQFLESMGFILSDLRYPDKPEEQKASLNDELPFLWDRLDRFAEARRQRLGAGDGRETEGRTELQKPAAGPAATEVRPNPVQKKDGGHGQDTGKIARLLASF